MNFKKATRRQTKARIALEGPSGSGKTYTALAMASGMGKKIAVIDTERGSASIYADKFDFDVLELDSFHPKIYIEAINSAIEAGYDVIVIDSLTHAWVGKDGVLEIKDRSREVNEFAKWKDATPWQERLIEALVQRRTHIIATMRTKTAYVIEENARGKQAPRKVGLAPIQREGMDYEFDVVGELNLNHTLSITKTRINEIDGMAFDFPGADIGQKIVGYLSEGEEDDGSDSVSVTDEYERELAKLDNDLQDAMKTCGLTKAELKSYIQDFNDGSGWANLDTSSKRATISAILGACQASVEDAQDIEVG